MADSKTSITNPGSLSQTRKNASVNVLDGYTDRLGPIFGWRDLASFGQFWPVPAIGVPIIKMG